MRAVARAWCCAALLAGACGQRAHGIEHGRSTDAGNPPETDGGSGNAGHELDAGRGESDAQAPSNDAGPPPPPDVPIVVTFVEVGLEAGLDYLQAEVGTTAGCEDFTPEKCPFTSTHFTGGAAATDVDGDGWVDVYVTRLTEPGILYLNRGDGTFEDATAEVGLDADEGSNAALFTDIDNDGDPDLYLTNVLRDRFALYVNAGGRFVEESDARGASVASSFRHHGFGIGAGDYDRDGFVDLHTTEWVQIPIDDAAPSHARLLRNRGQDDPGVFEDRTVPAGVSLLEGVRATRTSFSSSFADMDDDSLPELLVVADFAGSRLYWNDGDGLFTDGTLFSGVGSDQNGMGSAIGDYDGDGDLDWFVSSIFDPDYQCDNVSCGWGVTGNRLYRNLGDRQFVDMTDVAGVRDGYWGWGAAFFDYDNDGWLDLVQTNGVDYPNPESERFQRDPTCLWHNRGDGTFDEVAAETGIDEANDGRGLLLLDFDADGDEDVLIAEHEGRARLFRNDGGDQNAWLRVRLRGTRSNRDALGARVLLTRRLGEGVLLRELVGGSQFLGQSEPVLHFGLGAHEGPVARVEVRWPSGATTRLEDVPSRQLLELTE